MRRSLFVIVLLTLVVAAVGSAVGERDTQAQPAGPKREPVAPPTPTLPVPEPDVVSGCVRGANLVRVLIYLRVRDYHCVPEVTPSSVCVRPGGAVLFKMRNECGFAEDPDRPAIVIDQPSLKRGLDGSEKGCRRIDLFRDCQLRFEHLKKGDTPTFKCTIDPNAAEGFYKYALRGQIDWLDPDVEVHQ